MGRAFSWAQLRGTWWVTRRVSLLAWQKTELTVSPWRLQAQEGQDPGPAQTDEVTKGRAGNLCVSIFRAEARADGNKGPGAGSPGLDLGGVTPR